MLTRAWQCWLVVVVLAMPAHAGTATPSLADVPWYLTRLVAVEQRADGDIAVFDELVGELRHEARAGDAFADGTRVHSIDPELGRVTVRVALRDERYVVPHRDVVMSVFREPSLARPELPLALFVSDFEVGDGKVLLSGRTAPGARVDVLLDGKRATRVVADEAGTFDALARTGKIESPVVDVSVVGRKGDCSTWRGWQLAEERRP